jgi:hypothetical protein
MAAFDAIKAQREILQGMQEIYRVIRTRAKEAEQQFTETEANFNALAKLERFTEDLVQREQEKLNKLEAEAQ